MLRWKIKARPVNSGQGRATLTLNLDADFRAVLLASPSKARDDE